MLKYLNTLRILYTKELRNRFNSEKRSDYPKFLIVGLPRSGTTLLHTYLNSHPNIVSAGEKKIELIRQELQEVGSWKKVIFPPFSRHIKTAGAKVLLPDAPDSNFLSVLKEIIALEPSIKFLFLNRENLLRWYVSLNIARNTGQWSQTKGQNRQPIFQKKLRIPVNHLIDTLEETLKTIAVYRDLLSHTNMKEISYEFFSENPSSALAEVQGFFGLNTSPLSSLLQKQNPEPLHELIQNYEDVKQVLAPIPFQKFITD